MSLEDFDSDLLVTDMEWRERPAYLAKRGEWDVVASAVAMEEAMVPKPRKPAFIG